MKKTPPCLPRTTRYACLFRDGAGRSFFVSVHRPGAPVFSPQSSSLIPPCLHPAFFVCLHPSVHPSVHYVCGCHSGLPVSLNPERPVPPVPARSLQSFLRRKGFFSLSGKIEGKAGKCPGERDSSGRNESHFARLVRVLLLLVKRTEKRQNFCSDTVELHDTLSCLSVHEPLSYCTLPMHGGVPGSHVAVY